MSENVSEIDHQLEMENSIIKVLLDWEDSLSDGYEYYCGYPDTDEELREELRLVAKDILACLKTYPS